MKKNLKIKKEEYERAKQDCDKKKELQETEN